MKNNKHSLYQTFIRASILTGITCITIGLLVAFQTAKSSFNDQEDEKDQSYASILSSLIAPNMTISNYREIQSLLTRSNNEFFEHAVVDPSGEVILADYSVYSMVKSIVPSSNQLDCSKYPKKAEFKFSKAAKIICYPLLVEESNDSGKKSQVGLLIIFRKMSEQTFSVNQFLVVSIALIFIVLMSILILHALAKKRIVDPLEVLMERISNSQSKLDFESVMSNSESLPIEYLTIIQRLQDLHDLLKKEQQARHNIEKDFAMAGVAKQVAHDIRSPLTALNLALRSIVNLDEDKRIMIRNSVSRINDISNQLLEKSKNLNQSNLQLLTTNDSNNTATTLQVTLLSPLIESIISEKRILFRDKIMIVIEEDLSESYGLFAKIDPVELKRIISNLVNNSIEAFAAEKGRVVVSLKAEGSKLKLTIQDNGKGMPEEIRQKLGDTELSFGKENSQSGSGLGIYHAKKSVLSFGGTFEIESQLGNGTKIIITLPKETAPDWFVDQIKISDDTQIISIDDDLSIHSVWRERLSAFSNSNKIEHITFTSGLEFKEWLKKNGENSNRIYLVDYEFLNQPQTGLDLIEELGISKNSILVTSRYEESDIRSRCDKLKLKLIPKAMAVFVPISNLRKMAKYDGILIDDDSLMHLAWSMSAKDNKKSLLCFSNPDDFFIDSPNIDKATVLYVDSSLANGVKGEVISQTFFEKGFENIYLCTGYEPDTFPKMPWIKGILGKDPQL